ncbi:uncharacterized protein Z520_00421 [Fonsecaea multimorphosa CBS 102226]|uniref:AB hydrolase-1 domain-containing protein n=1 Tax=Fonsecaea multimorphosa CBS 102226 TaxID=1442371 RepID=A0A0D2KJS6_9EURO|nr:uncharacterized protein Z520_00421 [Fonsecaea multimorphosa CBS 102226]KIY03730.1 hypothetical protein Z520_00421 [Fonsecaea multimorphosa CBS 102226]OAL32427.1 hypothetical protein AYO22_00449 [Fonsecaea multimorphosa]
MRKTLLLVFIHGFKGGDDTFAVFPEHLRALVSHALPNIDVVTVTYPKFETRGELSDCVARFREWLQNKVIDLEVARSTPSPTVDPSVHVILAGHSMGGIVAAETYLLLASEQPIPARSSAQNPERPNFPSNTTLGSTTSTSRPVPSHHESDPTSHSFMFPHIQGVLAFDTPFLGLAPGMVAHGIEGGHKVVANAYNTYSEVASMFGWGSKSEPNVSSTSPASGAKSIGALPAPASSSTEDAAAAPKWQAWGKYAMFAGAAGAVVAGGAAALYSQRERLSAGWKWASDHLLFVGELFKPEYLQKRVKTLEQECKARGAGCANLYTNLGKGASGGYGITETLAGKERTFCNLPVQVDRDRKEGKEGTREETANGFKWIKAVNDKASDETTAHVSMFIPRDNPGFYALGEHAKECIAGWVDPGWYRASNGPTFLRPEPNRVGLGESPDGGWVKPDADEIRARERAKDRYGNAYKDPDADADVGGNLGKDWDSLEVRPGKDGVDDLLDGEDLRMREEDEELEGSVIVEKMAANGEVPLPKSRSNTGL